MTVGGLLVVSGLLVAGVLYSDRNDSDYGKTGAYEHYRYRGRGGPGLFKRGPKPKVPGDVRVSRPAQEEDFRLGGMGGV